MTKKRSLVIFMERFPNTYFIDKKDRVFKAEISTLNVNVTLRTLREMGLR